MRLNEFKNKKIDITLESIIAGFSDDRKNKIKNLVREFNSLVEKGLKKENDLFDFLEENYDKTL